MYLGPGPGGGWGVSRPTSSRSRPHTWRGVQAIPGGVEAQAQGCIPVCTEADTPSRRLMLRAVRILLECIVVTDKRAKKKLKCNCMQLDFCRKA